MFPGLPARELSVLDRDKCGWFIHISSSLDHTTRSSTRPLQPFIFSSRRPPARGGKSQQTIRLSWPFLGRATSPTCQAPLLPLCHRRSCSTHGYRPAAPGMCECSEWQPGHVNSADNELRRLRVQFCGAPRRRRLASAAQSSSARAVRWLTTSLGRIGFFHTGDSEGVRALRFI